MGRPNILLFMTDEERYPPPYEPESVRSFRASQLTARESIRSRGVEFHRHYAGSTACVPSRATLFTGQYPSLHGVTSTDGGAKQNTDPGMHRLGPNSVPMLGDWLRAGGYRTHYRGKWHVSHAGLTTPGSHEGLVASAGDGNPLPEAVEAYRKADRLDPFGFSGWIGREPHGAAKSDCGTVRDGVFAEQVTAGVAAHHDEVQSLPGRDLSGVIRGVTDPASLVSPVYFMTEDDVTRGITQVNILTGTSFDSVAPPTNIESVLTTLPTGEGGAAELWKLNHYYERLDEWSAAQGIAPNPFAGPAAEPAFELHNLTADPQERHNLSDTRTDVRSQMTSALDAQRDAKRRLPALRNPVI